jgi:hypothetical protein
LFPSHEQSVGCLITRQVFTPPKGRRLRRPREPLKRIATP